MWTTTWLSTVFEIHCVSFMTDFTQTISKTKSHQVVVEVLHLRWKQNMDCKRLLDDVYSSDNLPQHPGPKLLVANTDTSDGSGERWIVISVDGCGNVQFFYSFGRPPNGTFRHYLNKHCGTWRYNKAPFQTCWQRIVWTVLCRLVHAYQ